MSSEKRSLSIVSLIQIALILAMLACRAVPGALPIIETPTLTANSPRPTDTPTATLTASPSRPPTVTTQPTGSASPSPSTVPTETPYSVNIHPEGGLYVGDQVSFEIIGQPPDGGTQANIEIATPDTLSLEPVKFEPFGIAGRQQATFVWAWDTSNLAAGSYTATFRVGEVSWQQSIELRPASERHEGQWASVVTNCCTLYYVTDTAAARDIDELAAEADAQAQDATRRMGISFTQPITVTLLSRVLGHGGFANDEIAISYLDNNYANNRFDIVLHHEMIHILDARLGGDYRPSLFVEGLAVYMTGGHFKPEPLMERAAALLQIEGGEWYIPLADLADNFYLSQHEIGYLEGAALITYMVDRWGWDAFSAFYRGMKPTDDKRPSSAIDAALKEYFDLSFADLEADFQRTLRKQQVSAEQVDDLRLTVIYFDTLRRYQRLLDPSAYFATAWLMDSVEMRRRGIVADYVRHPNGPANLALEAQLMEASRYLTNGEYDKAEATLTAIETALNALE
jgi:hypothetical protein